MRSFHVWLSYSCCVLGIVIAASIWRVIEYAPVDLAPLVYLQTQYPTTVIDAHGAIITQFCAQRYEPLDISEVPTHVIHAFLAAEDHHFFTHHGLSVRGIVRSVWKNIRTGRSAQGGSTITQQLVKLAYLDQRKRYTRKIKEAWMTWQLERCLSKEQILQAYLNHIYVGCGIYGLKAAARYYCDCTVSELTVAQAAMLAGIVQNPERINPAKDPARSRVRRNAVLGRMATCGFITPTACTQYQQEPLPTPAPTPAGTQWYALQEDIRLWALNQFGKEAVYHTGLVIQTTLDRDLMIQLYTVFQSTCKQLDARQGVSIDGGLMLIQGSTGAIRAMISGRDPATYFDRARHARRQIGSLIKPLVYYGALQQGAHMDDTLIDEPIELVVGGQRWSPRNYHRQHVGPVSRAYSLTRSLNTCAVQTILTAGVERVAHLAQRCHVAPVVPPYPSLALGCVDVTVQDAAAFFNMFAQQGVYRRPWYIMSVKDRNGTILYQHTDEPERILSWKTVSQVSYTLAEGFARYKVQHDKLFPRAQVIGKTGTTNGASSCWCGAATPELTCVAYLGRDDNAELPGLFAYRSVLPLVLATLKTAEDTGYEPALTTFAWHPDLHPAKVPEPAIPGTYTTILRAT